MAALETGDDSDEWNSTFAALANVDQEELAEVGQDFTNAFLTSTTQALPYRDRAVKLCTDAGWTAPPTSLGD